MELIKLGNISGLREKVTSDDKNKETIAYHRNLGENYKKNKPMVCKTINELQDILFDTWIGYIYLYDEKTNKWLWDNYSIEKSDLNLKPLEDYFELDIKNINI